MLKGVKPKIPQGVGVFMVLKTMETNKMPDIAGFLQEMKKLGVEVKVSSQIQLAVRQLENE